MADVEGAKTALTKEQKTFSGALGLAFSKATNIVLDPKRLISLFYSQCQRNPELSKCTIPSVVVSILACAELGLEPGYKAYLIPYRNNKANGIMECHFQVGYKGLIDLFYRHPSAAKVEVNSVDKEDEFVYEYGLEDTFRHIPSSKKSGEIIAYYAKAKLKTGETMFKVMYPDEIRKHGLRYSKMVDKQTNDFKYNSLWKTDFESMAKKTVLIQLMKTLPNVSQEIEHALEADRVDRKYDGRMKSVFEMPKEEPEVIIDAECNVVEEPKGGEAAHIPPVAKPPVKEKAEIDKEIKSATDKKIDAAEEQKKKDLKFLIALAKSQGKKIDEAAFEAMDIDEALVQLKKATQELI